MPTGVYKRPKWIGERISLAKKGKSAHPNSGFKKGHVGYKGMLGRHQTEEAKRVISETHKGKRNSPATEFKKGKVKINKK